MGTIHRLDTATTVPTIAEAAEAFLAGTGNPNTARAYRSALVALADRFGAHRPLPVLDGEQIPDRVADWFAATWGTAAPATFNARLGALASAAARWRDQGWLSGDPLVRIRRLPRTPDHTRALDRAEVERLLTREGAALRERTLWQLLYESAARAEEVLALDVEELDLRNRRAKVRRKGGAADVITWRTATARLLPRLLVGRSSGPVFPTDRRARVELPAKDIDAGSGRARLSHRRAAELFSTAAGGATQHQLRHPPHPRD
ncbi:tyrosine-type recombinase/integrase [Thermobifida alba]|uniref:tyrosine-type recombinase/integrase n=1 Tax=Thermobifida alba TaxID=53522 RepID=UPI00200A8829|nr:tyrosine-type recombinase/integrase [Thermobifida alba]